MARLFDLSFRYRTDASTDEHTPGYTLPAYTSQLRRHIVIRLTDDVAIISRPRYKLSIVRVVNCRILNLNKTAIRSEVEDFNKTDPPSYRSCWRAQRRFKFDPCQAGAWSAVGRCRAGIVSLSKAHRSAAHTKQNTSERKSMSHVQNTLFWQDAKKITRQRENKRYEPKGRNSNGCPADGLRVFNRSVTQISSL